MEWLWLGQLILFGAVAFVQNVCFTWVSRSRNSGDPTYHRWAALCSNGIWFVTNVMVMSYVWAALKTGSWWELASAGVVYVLATSEGSVAMMRYLLKHERGSRRVGANNTVPPAAPERVIPPCPVCDGDRMVPPCTACGGTGKKARGL